MILNLMIRIHNTSCKKASYGVPFQSAVSPSSLAMPQPVDSMPRYRPTCTPLSPYQIKRYR